MRERDRQKESILHIIYDRVLLIHKVELNHDIFRSMGRTGDPDAKKNKPDLDKHCTFSLTCGI